MGVENTTGSDDTNADREQFDISPDSSPENAESHKDRLRNEAIEAPEGPETFERNGQTAEIKEEFQEDVLIAASFSCSEESSDSAQAINTGSSAKEAKAKPWCLRWYTWISALFIVCIAAGIAYYFISDRATMPDIVSMSPYEGATAVEEVSSEWHLEFVTEEGESAEILDENSFNGYEIKSVDPSAGSSLSKRNGKQAVVITIGKTEETLAVEKAAREAILQSEVDGSLANGWASEEYIDEGDLVIFIPVSTNSSLDMTLVTDYSAGDENEEWFSDLANQLQSNIIVSCYSSDGYLTQLYALRYDNATDEELEKMQGRFAQIVDDNKRFCEENRTAFLDKWADDNKNNQDVDEVEDGVSISEIEYTLDTSSVVLYVYFDSSSLKWGGTPKDQDYARWTWQTNAFNIAKYTNCDSVLIQLFTSDYELFDSFSYERSSSEAEAS